MESPGNSDSRTLSLRLKKKKNSCQWLLFSHRDVHKWHTGPVRASGTYGVNWVDILPQFLLCIRPSWQTPWFTLLFVFHERVTGCTPLNYLLSGLSECVPSPLPTTQVESEVDDVSKRSTRVIYWCHTGLFFCDTLSRPRDPKTRGRDDILKSVRGLKRLGSRESTFLFPSLWGDRFNNTSEFTLLYVCTRSSTVRGFFLSYVWSGEGKTGVWSRYFSHLRQWTDLRRRVLTPPQWRRRDPSRSSLESGPCNPARRRQSL